MPKPLLDQIGDELDEAGVQIYSYEQANKVRDQEQQLWTNQINYTNQQIHFFNQCYLPQILDSLYKGKISQDDRVRIHEKLFDYLIDVEHSLAEIEHPKDGENLLEDKKLRNSKNNMENESNTKIVTLEDAKQAFNQSKLDFEK